MPKGAAKPPAVAGTDRAAPLMAAEFAALMLPAHPFEERPLLAVAVSGGADSMALCLLAAEWAAARGGTIVTLTVDHGLRPAAAAEARQVGEWLACRGIAHRILRWQPPDGLHGVQAAAREARYALLLDWCRDAGCLHLLTAHHRDDQAETFLLRLARGSGLDGLAAMPMLRETPACRILRPLLAVPRSRLAATLRSTGQAWVSDPSNEDMGFARARLRGGAALLEREGLGARRLAGTAQRLGQARAAFDREVARQLAASVALHPAGFAFLDAAPLAAAAPEVALRALARLVMTVGGAAHTARLDRLERLLAALRDGLRGGRTLGGCRFLRYRGRILVCREVTAAPAEALPPGKTIHWDGRFMLRLASAAPAGLSVGALGAARPGDSSHVPGAARPSLPAIRDLVGIVAVPHLEYERPDRKGFSAHLEQLAFRPTRVLAGAPFTVV